MLVTARKVETQNGISKERDRDRQRETESQTEAGVNMQERK